MKDLRMIPKNQLIIKLWKNEVLTELQALESNENTVTTEKKPQTAAPVLLMTKNLK